MTELVVLLDDAGAPVGVADKAEVHSATTPLHLAFSCHVVDHEGRVLVTRRALSKRTWPGVWTNSVCGHPAPGESSEDAVRRRALHELGVRLGDLVAVVPDFRYRAVDASGVVEHEVCPIYVAHLAPGETVRPHPDEVMEFVWVEVEDLLAAVRRTPWALSPWLVQSGPALAAAWRLP